MKRTNVYQSKEDGGLNMIDIDNFILSIKASWVEKLNYKPGKWADFFKYYTTKIGLDTDYIWKTSFRDPCNFPVMKHLPQFYQDIVVAFNKANPIQPFKQLNPSQVAWLPLWRCEYFKAQTTCLYIKSFIKANILYVKI